MVETASQKQTLIISNVIRFVSGYMLGLMLPFIFFILFVVISFVSPFESTIFDSTYFYGIYTLLFFIATFSLISYVMNLKPKYFYLNFFILFFHIVPFYFFMIFMIEGNSDVIQTQEQIRAQEWATFLALSLYSAIVSAIGMLNPILLIKNWKIKNTIGLRWLPKSKPR